MAHVKGHPKRKKKGGNKSPSNPYSWTWQDIKNEQAPPTKKGEEAKRWASGVTKALFTAPKTKVKEPSKGVKAREAVVNVIKGIPDIKVPRSTSDPKQFVAATAQKVIGGARTVHKYVTTPSPEAAHVPDPRKVAPPSSPAKSNVRLPSKPKKKKVRGTTPELPINLNRSLQEKFNTKVSKLKHAKELERISSTGSLVEQRNTRHTKHSISDNRVQKALSQLQEFKAGARKVADSTIVGDTIRDAPRILGQTLNVMSKQYTKTAGKGLVDKGIPAPREFPPPGSLNWALNKGKALVDEIVNPENPLFTFKVPWGSSSRTEEEKWDDVAKVANANASSANTPLGSTVAQRKKIVMGFGSANKITNAKAPPAPKNIAPTAKGKNGGPKQGDPIVAARTIERHPIQDARKASTPTPDIGAESKVLASDARAKLKKDKPSAISQGISNLFGAKYTPGHRDPTTGEMTTSPHAKFNPKTDPVKALYERKKRKEKGWSNTAFPK